MPIRTELRGVLVGSGFIPNHSEKNQIEFSIPQFFLFRRTTQNFSHNPAVLSVWGNNKFSEGFTGWIGWILGKGIAWKRIQINDQLSQERRNTTDVFSGSLRNSGAAQFFVFLKGFSNKIDLHPGNNHQYGCADSLNPSRNFAGRFTSGVGGVVVIVVIVIVGLVGGYGGAILFDAGYIGLGCGLAIVTVCLCLVLIGLAWG